MYKLLNSWDTRYCFTKAPVRSGAMEGRKGRPYTCPKWMKKRLLMGLTVCLMLFFVLYTQAQADYVPVKLEVTVSPSTMSGPRTVDVNIRVTNTGDDDLPGNVSLYAPNGEIDANFGDGGSTPLKIGAVYTATTTWKVTDSQLDSGKLTYQLKYPVYNDEGELVRKSISASASIKRSVPDPEIVVKRTLSTNMAKKGQELTVTYDIENTGDVAIESIKIKEHKNISSAPQSIASLDPGGLGRAVFNVTMGSKDLTSEATITYKAAGKTKTYTYKVEATKITYGSPSLEAKLEASAKSVTIDETVKLKLTLSNTGNVDYQNIRVSDDVLGEVFTNQQVAAGQKLELEKEVPIRESRSFTFNIEATDSAGNAMTLATSKVDVAAIDPSKKLELQVSATSSSDVIYEEPGVLVFKVSVTNPSEVEAKEVKITCGTTLLYTFDVIKAGQTRSFTRDVAATQAGKFQFVASTKDQLNNTVTFESNAIQITYTQPTPQPTTAPTLPAPTLVQEEVPTAIQLPSALTAAQSVFRVLGSLVTLLLLTAVVLLAFATFRRAAAKKASDSAYDHLERAARRDYSQEAPRKADEDADEETAADDDTSSSEADEDALLDGDLFDIKLPPLSEDADDSDVSESQDDPESLAAQAESADDTEPTSAREFARRRRTSRGAESDKEIQA